MPKVDGIQDFYDLAEITSYDLSKIYYMIVSLDYNDFRKDKPQKIRDALEEMKYHKICPYCTFIMDLPTSEYKLLEEKAEARRQREIKRNKEVLIDINKKERSREVATQKKMIF